jgi:hypothetical protein
MVDTRNDQRLSRIFANKVIKRYPAFAEFYGMEEAIEQVVSYFRHAAQGLEEKKQILYLLGPVGGGKSSARRAPEAADAGDALLRDQGLAGQRVAAGPVQRREKDGGSSRKEYGIPQRYLQRVLSPGPSSGCRSTAATSAGSGGQALPVDPASRWGWPRPSRATRTTRTSARWWARWTSASWRPTPRTTRTPTATRRAVPGQPGPAGVRRDVQGADQGAAPAADRHAGGQLQGHRGLRRDSLRRHRAGAQQRERMEGVSQQQEQRGLPRPHLHRQGAVLPARQRGGEDLREAAPQLVAGAGALRARHAEDDGAVRGAHAPEGAGELVSCIPRCRSTTART